jgi:sodium-dependent dicarboxylate transporter 2/3/5
VTEAIPLFATSLLVVFLEMILLANPGGWPGLGFAGGNGPGASFFINAAADSTVLLFFGGLMLGAVMESAGVGAWLSGRLLRPFGNSPRNLLAGVLSVTAIFSLWMSNTATTAMMLAVVAPLVVALPAGDPLRRSLVLAVAIGANLGGMGTPIASPPNAIALGALRQEGVRIGFGSWMLAGIPIMLLLFVVSWVILLKLFPSRTKTLPPISQSGSLLWKGRIVLGILIVTVSLWLSEAWHGLPGGIVALGAVLALICTGVAGAEDLKRMDWSVLMLIGGSLALGAGMQATALDRWLVAALPLPPHAGLPLIAVFVLATITLGTFISNTATASLILPMALAAVLARAVEGGRASEMAAMAMAVALASSLGMALPVSTPPNAMVFAQGEIRAADLARVGALIGVIGAGVLMVAFRWIRF